MIGSLRQGSYSRSVFNKYQQLAVGKAEIVEAEIRYIPMFNEDLMNSDFPQSVLELGAQISDADGLIFFSPEYNYSVPAVLKNAIDWLSKSPNQPLAGKSASIISVSPGLFGGARMQYHMRQIGIYMDMRFLNRPEVMIGEVQKKIGLDGILADQLTNGLLENHLVHFSRFIEQQKRP